MLKLFADGNYLLLTSSQRPYTVEMADLIFLRRYKNKYEE